MMNVKFSLGQLVITPNAMHTINPVAVLQALKRHVSGDWGDCDAEDKARNDEAITEGTRLFSVYHSHGIKFWIITEADRSVTTVLMPEDY